LNILCLFLSGTALAELPMPSTDPKGEAVNLLTNGSFEFWSHLAAERADDVLKRGPVFEGTDPLVPTRWNRNMGKANTIARATPLPWNRLGTILEKRRDYEGALKAYSLSLKVEWNQPPTLEAKTKMEKLLNPK